ncbi:hypothetical protein [Vibrio rotiferianus]|uniref:hypothetical protein n=1 Tax=Vibrio rotiferianus TaxID=190895 RepID=UPI00117F574C|nr:hypothetical protein [Vibrio rotiferianus]
MKQRNSEYDGGEMNLTEMTDKQLQGLNISPEMIEDRRRKELKSLWVVTLLKASWWVKNTIVFQVAWMLIVSLVPLPIEVTFIFLPYLMCLATINLLMLVVWKWPDRTEIESLIRCDIQEELHKRQSFEA